MAPRVKPIPLRLNPNIQFEATLREQYDTLPRARRQEFLRQILRLGWDAWHQGQVPGASAPAVPVTPARAASLTPAAPARMPPAAHAGAASVAPVATSTGESSKALKGFFGEDQQ